MLVVNDMSHFLPNPSAVVPFAYVTMVHRIFELVDIIPTKGYLNDTQVLASNITARSLYYAAYEAGFGKVFDDPAVELDDDDYKDIASILGKRYNWPVVKSKETNAVIFLYILIKLIRNHWRSVANMSAVPTTMSYPTKPQKECLEAMLTVITTYSKPLSTQGQTVTVQLLFEASRRANIYGINNATFILNEREYQKWADILISDLNVSQRNPKWNIILKKARNQVVGYAPLERKIKLPLGAPASSINQTTIHAQQKVTKPMSNEAVAFSEVSVRDGDDSLFSGTIVSRRCDFCTSEQGISQLQNFYLNKLVTNKKSFYCPFCIRNDYHTRRQNNIMIVTLRGMIGYIYNTSYFGKTPSLYVAQIQDMVNNHVKIGNQNPLFSYDSSTFCWFIDFNKIGKRRKQLPLADNLNTINDMISAFNPYNHIPDFDSAKYTSRFSEAMTDFYQNRYRPPDKKICAPTLAGCACDLKEVSTGTHTKTTKKIPIAEYRHFMPHDLTVSSRR